MSYLMTRCPVLRLGSPSLDAIISHTDYCPHVLCLFSLPAVLFPSTQPSLCHQRNKPGSSLAQMPLKAPYDPQNKVQTSSSIQGHL